MNDLIRKWQNYLHSINDWQLLIKNIQPKQTGCGLVYEISYLISAENESFAIADMSNLAFSEPHYHPETEIYFILQGTGLVVIGGQEIEVQKCSVVVIPSSISHFTVPEKDLVIAVVNKPPFSVDNYHPLTQDNSTVKFDRKQFEKLIKK